MDNFIIHTWYCIDNIFGLYIIRTILILSTISIVCSIYLSIYYFLQVRIIKKAKQTALEEGRTKLIVDYHNGLIGQRINQLRELTDKEINHEILSAISKAEVESSRIHMFVHYVAGILILMGLLGTFVGLNQVVNDVSSLLGMFDNIGNKGAISEFIDSIIMVIQDMKKAINGLNIAFYTSIAGLLGTLLVSTCNLILTYFQNKALLELESMSLTVLIPIFSKEEKEDNIKQRTLTILTALEEKTKVLTSNIIAFNEILHERTEQLNTTIHTIASNFVESSELFKNNIDNCSADFRNKVEQISETFIDRCSNGSETFRKTIIASSQEFKTIINSIESIDIGKDAKKVEQALESLSSSVNNTSGVFNAVLDRYESFTELFHSYNSNLNSTIMQLCSVVNDNEKKILALNIHGRNYLEVMAENANKTMEIRDEFRRSAVLFDEWVETVSNEIESVFSSFQSVVNRDREVYLKSFDKVLTEFKRNIVAMQNLNKKIISDLHKTNQINKNNKSSVLNSVKSIIARLKNNP